MLEPITITIILLSISIILNIAISILFNSSGKQVNRLEKENKHISNQLDIQYDLNDELESKYGHEVSKYVGSQKEIETLKETASELKERNSYLHSAYEASELELKLITARNI